MRALTVSIPELTIVRLSEKFLLYLVKKSGNFHQTRINIGFVIDGQLY